MIVEFPHGLAQFRKMTENKIIIIGKGSSKN